MDKGGCLFFLRARWRVSSKSLSRGRGSSSNMAALLFALTGMPQCSGSLVFTFLFQCLNPALLVFIKVI
jgi:hypothetical protein